MSSPQLTRLTEDACEESCVAQCDLRRIINALSCHLAKWNGCIERPEMADHGNYDKDNSKKHSLPFNFVPKAEVAPPPKRTLGTLLELWFRFIWVDREGS
jgi:hypothetical protein